MAGFDNDNLYAGNVDFRGVKPVVGQVTADGQLLIGSTATPNIKVGSLGSSDSSITWTVGSGTITGQVSGGTTVGKTITGNSGGALSPTAGNWNIVGGTGALTSGPGSTLTINVSGAGLTWTAIGLSQTLAVNNGYICNAGGALSLALPAVSSVGDMIAVTLDGSTSWTITQGAGQQIRLGNTQTTAGAGGSLASSDSGDTIIMVCSVANLKWNVIDVLGNITIV